MNKSAFLLLGLLLTLPACLREEASTTSAALFEELWEEFDRHYAYFTYKQVDWEAAYSRYAPQAAAASPAELRGLLCQMLSELQDGHVNLYTPEGSCGYRFWAKAPANTPLHAAGYLSGLTSLSPALAYGRLQSRPEIAYLRIARFSGEEADFAGIDDILRELADTKALLIDLRDNGGGSDRFSELIASRFATERRLYRRFRYRNGPGHDQFSDWIEDFIQPAGPAAPYTSPVYLLTNRRCFSATEDFILAMRQYEQVQSVGDTTGGGSGNPIFRELSNGWVYRLSHWQMQGPDGASFEGIGLPPDHLQWISREDSLAARDAILERALSLID